MCFLRCAQFLVGWRVRFHHDDSVPFVARANERQFNFSPSSFRLHGTLAIFGMPFICYVEIQTASGDGTIIARQYVCYC